MDVPRYPLLFGDPDQRLYGVYHMPQPSCSTDAGVVLCQPLQHEYPNAHRAFRLLADRLAQVGLHAFRFDFYGTGDSAGECDEGDIDRWTADVEAAIDEHQAARGLKRVGLIGLRLGATLAAAAAARRDDISFLVLWEPIVRGSAYLDELRRLHEAWLVYEAGDQPKVRRLTTEHEVLGYPLTERQASGLRRTDLFELDAVPAERVLLVQETATELRDEIASHLEQLGATVDRESIDGGQVWTREFGSDQTQAPSEILSAIVDWSVENSR